MSIPVFTLSPVSSSDIGTDLPFSKVTLAVDGKQPPPPDGGGGGAKYKYYYNTVIVLFSYKIIEKIHMKDSTKLTQEKLPIILKRQFESLEYLKQLNIKISSLLQTCMPNSIIIVL